ncbi:hypothetical protein CJJ07_001642 [Candidozyma auris]|nr:hypothetical protein CJJ07_001642 [[Candida] auris]QEL60119.1 hypothetical protein CJJ09_002213 [[Candida] auris]
MTTEGEKLLLKPNLPRTRDMNFVGRFHQNYGFEEGLFEYLLAQKEIWGDKLFFVDENQFRAVANERRHLTRDLVVVEKSSLMFAEVEGSEISENAFKSQFGSEPKEVIIAAGGNESREILEAGNSLNMNTKTKRNSSILNVGGIITALKWLPYGPFLAIAVAYHEGGLSNAVKSPSLSVFSGGSNATEIKSCIQLYKYDSTATSLTLERVLITSSFGAASSINWLPFKVKEDGTCVLSALFTDGRVHFFRIGSSSPESKYIDVKSSSWTISLKDERSDSSLPITAYDIFDESKVIVGTIDGAIAEFVLPGFDDHPDIPSFVNYVADSAINTITVGRVFNGHVLLVNTATTRSFAILYENLRQSRVEVAYTVSDLPPRYHEGYRIFIYPDSAETIGYSFARHPQQKQSLLLQTELISSFHTSEFLNHPLAIVGNVAGDFYVMNIARKIIGVPKAHNRLVVPLRIWSFSLETDRTTLRLSGDYVPTTADKSNVAYSFTPHEIGISACAWNEDFDGSSTYAMGTYSGLLVLERLDPAFN